MSGEPGPEIAILADTNAELLIKRLWAALPSPDYRMVIYKSVDQIVAEMDKILLIFVDMQNMPVDMIENLYVRSIKCSCPGEIVGVVIDEAGGAYHDAVKFCDIWLFLSQLGDAIITTRLRHRLHRAFSYYRLICEKEIGDILKIALSGSADAYLVFGKEGNLLMSGGACIQVLGPAATEHIEPDRSIQEISILVARESGIVKTHPSFTAWQKIWIEADQGKEIFVLPVSGRSITLRATSLPDGRARVISVTDVTHTVSQQEEGIKKSEALKQALLKERESSSLQQQFISMVSHEFRTPLSLIDGNAQLASRHAEKGETENLEKRLRTIRSAVSRLVQMMEGVLSSNLLRTGKMVLRPDKADLRAIIHQLCDEQRDLSPDNIINVSIESLPETINIDSKLVTLIITNLLSNAVKYGGKKPVVNVTAGSTDEEIVLSVADNGVGIPEDEKYKIFDRFFRATTSSGIPGTGIGLSLVKELVGLHNGRIEVQSTVGQGTTFTIFLPLKDSL